MAKAILEFDLNDPEDKEAHRMAINASATESMLFEYDSWLRDTIKYKDEQDWPSLEIARKKFLELLNEHGIPLFR